MMTYIFYILTGAFAGTMAGLLGIAGAVVVVPSLAFIFAYQNLAQGMEMQLAAGTSLAAAIITSLVSTYSHHQRHLVVWPLVQSIVPALIVGTIVGVLLADMISSEILGYLFAGFLFLIAARMLFYIPHGPHHKLPRSYILYSISFVMGIVAGLLGMGGGTLIAPFLSTFNVPIRMAAGTSAACGVPIAITGAIVAIMTGLNEANAPAYSLGHVYWPAAIIIAITSIFFIPLGARLSRVLPAVAIKNVFAGLLIITAIKMVLSL